MDTGADNSPPSSGPPWPYLFGLLLLLSPVLTPAFLLPVKDPRRREYLFFGGMGVALLEVAAIVLLCIGGRKMTGWGTAVTVVLCCVAGVLALFFVGLAQP